MEPSANATPWISSTRQNNATETAKGQQPFPETKLNNTQQVIVSNVRPATPDRSASLQEYSLKVMTKEEMIEFFSTKLHFEQQPEHKAYLQNLLEPPKIGNCDCYSIMAVGDADGSTARLILASLVTKKIKINFYSGKS